MRAISREPNTMEPMWYRTVRSSAAHTANRGWACTQGMHTATQYAGEGAQDKHE